MKYVLERLNVKRCQDINLFQYVILVLYKIINFEKFYTIILLRAYIILN